MCGPVLAPVVTSPVPAEAYCDYCEQVTATSYRVETAHDGTRYEVASCSVCVVFT